MDTRQIDLTEQMRNASEALARRPRPIRQTPTTPRKLGLAEAVVVVVLFAALASAYGIRAQRRDADRRPAFASDTSQMVRVDGSTPSSGRLFMTAVRKPRPLARGKTSGSAMETSRRNAVRAALDCVDPSRRRRVSIDPGRVTGPSAGLMFALTIVDALEPLEIDAQIAGTGTISPNGAIGPIGDIALKARAARDAGADMFLAPKTQAAVAARAAPGLHVIGVETLDEAARKLGRTNGCGRTEGKEER